MKEALPGMWPSSGPVAAANNLPSSSDGGDYNDKSKNHPQIRLSRPSGDPIASPNNFRNSAGLKSVVDTKNMTAKSYEESNLDEEFETQYLS